MAVNTTKLNSAKQAIEQLLQKIKEESLNEDGEVQKIVETLSDDFKILLDDLEEKLTRHVDLTKTLIELLPSNPDELVSTENFSHLRRYSTLVGFGADAQFIYKLALLEEVYPIMINRLLHKLFSTSLEEIERKMHEK